MTRLEDIKGLNATHAELIQRRCGISSTSALLKFGAKPAGRQALAHAVGVEVDVVLEWVNLAELIQIKGIGSGYLNLLEASGINTLSTLKKQNPETLHARLKRVNGQKQFVTRLPTLEMVVDWIEQANELLSSVEC